MSIRQQMLVTCLPTGRNGNAMRLSVLISPRLASTAARPQLQSFAFHQWPAKLSSLTFDVFFGGNGLHALAHPISGAPNPRDDLWDALFPGTTFVRSYKFPALESQEILSYPAANVSSFTENKYVKVATNAPDELLDAERLASSGYFGKIAPSAKVDGERIGGPKAAAIRRTLRRKDARGTSGRYDVAAIAPAAPNPAIDFALAGRFFDGEAQARLPITAPTAADELDFHQRVSALGAHPKLLRLLGLAADLEVDLPDAAGGLAGSQPILVWVVPRWSSQAPVSSESPPTVTRRSDFFPAARPPSSASNAPKESDLVGGLLNLANVYRDGRRVFELSELDADAAALKLTQFGSTVVDTVRRFGLTTTSQPSTTRQPDGGTVSGTLDEAEARKLAPPSLRSAGITLTRTGFAQKLKDQIIKTLDHQAALVNHRKPDLYADDLVRGFAIDVFDVTAGRWFPLCRREGEASFLSGNLQVPLEASDGWISLAVTSPPPGSVAPSAAKLSLHESMFRWDNWSLAVPPPGKTILPDGTATTTTVDSGSAALGLDVSYEVPTSPADALPILRYGRQYYVRARAVDLAGNVRAFGDPTSTDFTRAAGPFAFARLEPVLPPTLLFRRASTPGESVETMVVRSNFDTGDADALPCERHVAPPKTDQKNAEVHGMWDTSTGLDANAYSQIVAREHGSFDERDGAGNLVHPMATADEGNYGKPYYDVDTLTFDVEGSKTSQLPYLPDPIAHGTAFKRLPGDADGAQTRVSFTEDQNGTALAWPDRAPFRLVLRAGTAGKTALPGALEVSLPKGEVVAVAYSTYHGPEDIRQLALMRWIARTAEDPALPTDADDHDLNTYRIARWMKGQIQASARRASRESPDPPALELMVRAARDANRKGVKNLSPEAARLQKIVGGTLSLVGPDRTLTLVHAVRQPLIRPGIGSIQVARSLGWTFAHLTSYQLIVDEKSTSEVEIYATWTEVADVASFQGRQLLPREQMVLKHRIPVTPSDFPTRHDFGDTKYRKVTYKTVATTRFADFFTDRRVLRFDATTPAHVLDADPQLFGAVGVVPGSEAVKSLDGSVTYERQEPGMTGGDYALDYATGEIARVPGGRLPTNENVGVSYLSPPITRSGDVEETVKIPSSARPAAPRVAFVIPTFGWTRASSSNTVQSTRSGRGLRIYLERPWWSSGDEEMLGVIAWSDVSLAPQQGAASPREDKPTGKRTPKFVNLKKQRALPYVTRWGRDPAWSSAATTDLPTVLDFGGNPLRQTDLTIDEASNTTVGVAGYPVTFDDSRDLWSADVVINTSAYFPFVRLALAAYQPNSIPGTHLSRVVYADMIQLAPDRMLTMAFDNQSPRSVSVTLTGATYSSTEPGHPAEVEVSVEQRRPEVTDANDELGWELIGGSTVLLAGMVGAGGQGAWSGQLELPVDRGQRRLRLVVREFEKWEQRPATFTDPGLARRLVYVETVELPGPEPKPSPSASSSPSPSSSASPSATPRAVSPSPTTSPTSSPRGGPGAGAASSPPPREIEANLSDDHQAAPPTP
jgi:hypothetical protein